jgi:hypothetical protein
MMSNPQLDLEQAAFLPGRRSMFSRSSFAFFLSRIGRGYPGHSLSGFKATSRTALAVRQIGGGWEGSSHPRGWLMIPRARSHSAHFPMHYGNPELGRRSVSGRRP